MKPLISSSEVKMKTISVVIPVYNVEKYLSECLDSVINQTYKNVEIIANFIRHCQKIFLV